MELLGNVFLPFHNWPAVLPVETPCSLSPVQLLHKLAKDSSMRILLSHSFLYNVLYFWLRWICCCEQASSGCDDGGCGLLPAVASLVGAHGLQVRGLQLRGLQQLWPRA